MPDERGQRVEIGGGGSFEAVFVRDELARPRAERLPQRLVAGQLDQVLGQQRLLDGADGNLNTAPVRQLAEGGGIANDHRQPGRHDPQQAGRGLPGRGVAQVDAAVGRRQEIGDRLRRHEAEPLDPPGQAQVADLPVQPEVRRLAAGDQEAGVGARPREAVEGAQRDIEALVGGDVAVREDEEGIRWHAESRPRRRARWEGREWHPHRRQPHVGPRPQLADPLDAGRVVDDHHARRLQHRLDQGVVEEGRGGLAAQHRPRQRLPLGAVEPSELRGVLAPPPAVDRHPELQMVQDDVVQDDETGRTEDAVVHVGVGRAVAHLVDHRVVRTPARDLIELARRAHARARSGQGRRGGRGVPIDEQVEVERPRQHRQEILAVERDARGDRAEGGEAGDAGTRGTGRGL